MSPLRIDRALRLTQRELFAPENGGRNGGIPKVLILLTDGSQTPGKDAEDPGDIADQLRAEGTETFHRAFVNIIEKFSIFLY